MKLVLASGSPRRRELLGLISGDFDVFSSPVEETGYNAGDEREPLLEPLSLPAPDEVPLDADPRLWAWRKAMDVVYTRRDGLKVDTLVLGADTVVVGPGRLLGKPKSAEDAVSMLLLLKGRTHYVVTGFALLRLTGREVKTLCVEASISLVVMRDYSLFELEGYVATGESMDKAGSYALQGLGGKLVERVEGCWTNVIGLPLCRVRDMLGEAGVRVMEYPQGGYCDYCTFMPRG